MAVLSILKFPDPRLHKTAQPVETFDEALQNTVNDMFETMYEAKGVGLAATQVDIHRRIVVVDTGLDQGQRARIEEKRGGQNAGQTDHTRLPQA